MDGQEPGHVFRRWGFYCPSTYRQLLDEEAPWWATSTHLAMHKLARRWVEVLLLSAGRQVTPRCDQCGATQGTFAGGGGGELKRCSRCKTPHYCSKECQKGAWKVHKRVCVAADGEREEAPPLPKELWLKILEMLKETSMLATHSSSGTAQPLEWRPRAAFDEKGLPQ